MTEAMLIFLLSLMGAFVMRVSGFGFGVFIMAWLPYLLPSYGEATALSGLLAMSASTVVVWRHRAYISWRKLLPMLATFVVVAFFAVRFVAYTDDGLLRRILGAVLIVASVWFLFVNKHVHLKPTTTAGLLTGTVAGAMGGLFAMQGPPAVLYLMACTDDKREYIALIQTFLLVGNVVMLGFRAQSGFVTEAVGWAYLYGIVAVGLGTWIGAKVFDRLSSDTVRTVVYIYLAISGLISLIK